MCTAASATTFDWLTRRECVALLQCSQSAFWRLVADGRIRKRDITTLRRYWREDVERLAAPPRPAA